MICIYPDEIGTRFILSWLAGPWVCSNPAAMLIRGWLIRVSSLLSLGLGFAVGWWPGMVRIPHYPAVQPRLVHIAIARFQERAEACKFLWGLIWEPVQNILHILLVKASHRASLDVRAGNIISISWWKSFIKITFQLEFKNFLPPDPQNMVSFSMFTSPTLIQTDVQQFNSVLTLSTSN